jgi:hypothetical protein
MALVYSAENNDWTLLKTASMLLNHGFDFGDTDNDDLTPLRAIVSNVQLKVTRE